MSHVLRTLALSLLLNVVVACGDAGNSGQAQGSAAQKDAAGPGLIAGLLDSATDMLPSEGSAAANSTSPGDDQNQPGSTDPIVKCQVKGETNFTRQSVCDNRGGQSVRMALKVKNAR